MKQHAMFLAMLVSFSPAFCTEAKRPTVPAVPKGIVEAERLAFAHAALMASKGQFDKAAAALQPLVPPASVQVTVDWVPVPRGMRAGYRHAAQQALHEWNAALAGALRFELTDREESADLRVLFEKNVALVRSGQAQLSCSDAALDTTPRAPGQPAGRRSGVVRLSLDIPYSEEMHSAASIGHLVGQALGSYLGLAPAEDAAELMGPDPHTNDVIRKPAPREAELARRMQQARLKLMGYVQQRVAVYLPKAVITVEKPEIDAGDVQQGQDAHYPFRLKNKGDAPLEIEAIPHCGCTVVDYDKVIAPGAEGKFEAVLHTTGFRGRVIKLVDVKSNDPETPLLSLRLGANILSSVQVLPADAAIIALKDEGPTIKELEVRTTGQDAPQVTRATCSAAYATAKLEPLPPPPAGGHAYKLILTIAPEAPVGRSVFLTSLATTSAKEPQVNVTAICDKGILAVPSTIYMGAVTPATPLPLTQAVMLMRNDGTFHVRKVESDDPKLEVQQETLKDGSQCRLMVRYKGGWPGGAVRSKITVQTDDPRQSRIEIPVTASVSR